MAAKWRERSVYAAMRRAILRSFRTSWLPVCARCRWRRPRLGAPRRRSPPSISRPGMPENRHEPGARRWTMSERAASSDTGEAVVAYKAILKRVLDNRPSGTRQRMANALGKNRSFVSQIANPAYPVPIPARHLEAIFEICHFSQDDRREFLAEYARAHPSRLSPVAPMRRSRTISVVTG